MVMAPAGLDGSMTKWGLMDRVAMALNRAHLSALRYYY
jgi:hypothetical protein